MNGLEDPVTGLIAPDQRCTAFWYCRARGLPEDLETRRELGLRAWRVACWYGVPYWPKIAEGPFNVLLWPEWVFDVAAADMNAFYGRQEQPFPGEDYQVRSQVARAWQLDQGYQEDEPGPGYWEAGDY